MTSTAVILINWNQAAITIRCIRSIEENTFPDPAISYDIIVVDNDSEKASVVLLETFLNRQNISQHHLVKNDRNLGYAGGINTGIKYALKHLAPDYIWILNNDIIVQPGALNQLVKAAGAYSKYQIWASSIYEVDPNLHFFCAGGFKYNPALSIPKPVTFSSEGDIPRGLYHPLPQMDYPAGAAMFIKRACIEKHGLLSEDYFLYYEELDYVRKIGGKTHLAWCPDSVLHHQSGKSTGSQNPNQGKGSWIGHYYGNLSALKFTWKYYPHYFPVVFFFRLFSKSFLFTLYRDFSSFAPLLKAYKDFFRWVADRSRTKKT